MMKTLNKKQLENIVREALNGIELKGNDYPFVSASEKDFGNSYYIQNSYGKIRISDHSVTNIDRILNEEHFSIRGLNIEILKETIIKIFSDEYCSLILKNGDTRIDFKKQVLKSEINDWVVAKVWFKEVQFLPIKLEEIHKWEVLEEADLTKKGNKRFCKVLRKKYSFGAFNLKTKKTIRTRFHLAGDFKKEVYEF